MGLFNQKKNLVAGVDISSTAVKMLELSCDDTPDGKKYSVISYAVEPLPVGAVVEKTVANVEAVSDALKKVLKKAKSKKVVAAVAGSSVMQKIVPLPITLKGSALEAQVRDAVENHFPYPIEELRYDFDELGPSSKSEDLKDILIVASRIETVDALMEAINSAGAECDVVDVEAYAIERAIKLTPNQTMGTNPKVVAIADIGAATLNITVMINGESYFAREQVFGGSMLTEQIQANYGMSYEEAGNAKRNGGLPEDYEQTLLKPFMESLVQQINRGINYYYTTNTKGNNSIDLLILTGGCAEIAGIKELAEERLSIPTQVARPFEHIDIHNRVDKERLMIDGPAMMVATGLAMRAS